MFSSLLAVIPIIFGASVAAQSNPAVVCVAGQCLQGFTNITIGATLSAPGAATKILLLPGQYTSTTNPQLLHDILTASSASLSPSPGFNSSLSLPLNLALQPGIASYPQANYSGSATFTQLPESNSSSDSTTFASGSVALSSNVWAAVSSSSNERLILWNSVPDLSQLPSGSASNSLSILDLQSSACSPPCSGAGICSASGTCSCPTGFTGSSCEACAPGFFGPTCRPCPAGCTSCDQGLSGSGRCLVPAVNNLPSSCNCLNGVCGTNGQCTCNSGWTTADNGTACAKCATGFFLNSNGNCQICNLGCTQCADNSGDCISCKAGFTQSPTDPTSCSATLTATKTGGIRCATNTFSNGTDCISCSPLCQSCTGATSNDCIICGAGKFTLNGNCVSVDGSGVCQGSTLVANTVKRECDSCPAKCTSCGFPNFVDGDTIDQVQCTGCLPGLVLSKGQCVQDCPLGTFLNPQDNLTCTACDSSCSSCAGSSTFCLTCANNQLASGGKCVSSCPSNSFSSSGSCITCHPDCATCSGSSFNQCSSCPADRPVLTNGRCLPTCSQTQFFDKTSSTCQSCDLSCSSCSGAGPSNCLACSSPNQVLRAGTCVSVTCSGSSSVIQGLGLCLSDVVNVPKSSGTNSAPPLPSITGLSAPTASTNKSTGRALAWWEILLMALGCAFIFLVIMMLWRRQARKKRSKATAAFASAKNIHPRTGWRWKLLRFGERLFGHKRSRFVSPQEDEAIKLEKLKLAEEARHERDMDKLLGAYEYSRAPSSRAPSPLPSLRDYEVDRTRERLMKANPTGNKQSHNRLSVDSLSTGSLYSHVTGLPRRGPEPRQPVKNARDLLPSRFSDATRVESHPPVKEGRNMLPSRFSDSSTSSPPPSLPSQDPFAASGSPPGDLLETARSPDGVSRNHQQDLLVSSFPLNNGMMSAPHAPYYDLLAASRVPAIDVPVPSSTPTPAQEYARLVAKTITPEPESRGSYWLQPTNTGNSESKNPFRR